MSKPKILAWDLELSPIVAETWSLWPKYIPIQMIQQTQRVICFGARWLGSKKVIFRSEYHDGRETMLSDLHELLSEADATLSWNGRGFDTKHANREFLLQGLTEPPPRVETDLMLAVKRKFKFASNKLDHVAQELGVGSKVKVDMSVWQECLGPDGPEKDAAWAKMKRYQRQDVDLLVDLYDRLLPWIPANMHPNAALYGDPEVCYYCGGDRIQSRGVYRTSSGHYPRFQCQNPGCKKWLKGLTRIGTSELRPA